MAIEAPLSKYKKQNLIIIIAVLVGVGIWCYRDGYHNPDFIKKHTTESGQPDTTLVTCQKSPPFLIGAGILVSVWFFVVRNKKIIADESGLKTGKQIIAYDNIEKINKTHFDSKGYFVVTCTDQNGQQKDIKLSDRTYDNLGAVLDHLISKIS